MDTRERRWSGARQRTLEVRLVETPGREARAAQREDRERKALGSHGEQAVAEHLEREGYTVLERNARARGGEVDLIAEREGVLCFVEVRSRATGAWGDPSQTVSFAKQRKIVRAAMTWLSRHRAYERVIRFDVASVVGRGREVQVHYIPDAFEAGF